MLVIVRKGWGSLRLSGRKAQLTASGVETVNIVVAVGAT